MNKETFPKEKDNINIGKAGQAFFQYFVINQLRFDYRPVHQENDFGIDGYIEIISNQKVTGKSLAV